MSHYDRIGLKWAKAVRWLLTAALLMGVYSETGLWTTVFAALVTLGLETEVAMWRRGGETQ